MADGAGDEEVTPAQVAAPLELAGAEPEVAGRPATAALLADARDALADGLPAEDVLRRLQLLEAVLESG